jgi:hypothetical protein
MKKIFLFSFYALAAYALTSAGIDAYHAQVNTPGLYPSFFQAYISILKAFPHQVLDFVKNFF